MQEEKLSHLKNLTLLLIEDDEELLHKMQTILSIFFKEVLIAKDGNEGYDLFFNSKVDMLITDYVMPGIDGYELCKKIREKNKNIPLVIMSNYSDKEKLLNVIPLSLAQYLVKPIEYTNLTKALISMVDRLEDSSYECYKFTPQLSYDNINKQIILDGEVLSLAKSEVTLIELFIENKDKIVSNSDIEYALDPTEEKSTHAIKTLIYRIRKKLGKDIIINIPSFGYMYKTS